MDTINAARIAQLKATVDRAGDLSQGERAAIWAEISALRNCLEQRCELDGGTVSILPRFAWKG